MRTVLFLLALLSATTCFSQNSGLKIDMFAPIVKTLVVGYERVVSESASFQISFNYTSDNTDGQKLRRVGFTPEYRFYFSETPAPAGFFVAPFFQYVSVTESSTAYNEVKYGEYGAGLVAGYQWLFKERVTFSAFFGPKYQKNTGIRPGVTLDLTDGFTLKGGVTLGFVF